jgi:hypothetical protein
MEIIAFLAGLLLVVSFYLASLVSALALRVTGPVNRRLGQAAKLLSRHSPSWPPLLLAFIVGLFGLIVAALLIVVAFEAPLVAFVAGLISALWAVFVIAWIALLFTRGNVSAIGQVLEDDQTRKRT